MFYFISYHKYKYILSIFISKEPCNPPWAEGPKPSPWLVEGFAAGFHPTDFLFGTGKPRGAFTGKYFGEIILGSIPLSLSEEMIQMGLRSSPEYFAYLRNRYEKSMEVTRTAARTRKPLDGTCRKCGEVGHMARKCEQVAKGPKQSKVEKSSHTRRRERKRDTEYFYIAELEGWRVEEDNGDSNEACRAPVTAQELETTGIEEAGAADETVETTGEKGGEEMVEANGQGADAEGLGEEAADNGVASEGPVARNGREDGGDADVDHTHATPKETWTTRSGSEHGRSQ